MRQQLKQIHGRHEQQRPQQPCVGQTHAQKEPNGNQTAQHQRQQAAPVHIPGSALQMGGITPQPLNTEGHQRHHQQHPHAVHRRHMVRPGTMTMRHVDDLAGRADGRREPGRPHIQTADAVIEPAADDRQHLGIQDAGKNEPPVLRQALHHLGGEVQPQRQPDDPAPELVERRRAPGRHAGHPGGRREKQRPHQPGQWGAHPDRQAGTHQSDAEAAGDGLPGCCAG